VLMSVQLPPPIRCEPSLLGQSTSYAENSQLQDEIAAWRQARVAEYSRELCLIERLEAEIRALRTKVSRQQAHAAYLTSENAKLARDKAALQSEFDAYRRESGRSPASSPARRLSSYEALEQHPFAEGGPASSAQGAGAAPSLNAPLAMSLGSLEVGDAGAGGGEPRLALPPSARGSSSPSPKSEQPSPQVLLRQLQIELDKAVRGEHGLASLQLSRCDAVPPRVSRKLQMRFDSCRQRLVDPSLTLRLYFAAPLPQLQKLLEDGFDSVPLDSSSGAYGRGWYFSKYASHAHCFSGGCGALLLALVAVGSTETVVRRNESRGAPSDGFDSIIIPGRPLPSRAPSSTGSASYGSFSQEYVIFDGSQAMPLYLLSYEAILA